MAYKWSSLNNNTLPYWSRKVKNYNTFLSIPADDADFSYNNVNNVTGHFNMAVGIKKNEKWDQVQPLHV